MPWLMTVPTAAGEQDTIHTDNIQNYHIIRADNASAFDLTCDYPADKYLLLADLPETPAYSLLAASESSEVLHDLIVWILDFIKETPPIHEQTAFGLAEIFENIEANHLPPIEGEEQ